ncbi:MAG: hypothetical protein NTV33_00945 [Coprothermobacterota bacterium]|nr:hypothetical protein [Coprothermobacterota bacterium]
MIIAFPGTAAPQCGICSDEREDNRPEEQLLRRFRSSGYLPYFDTEHPAGDYSAWNILRQHVTEHPAGGSLAAGW